MVNLTFGEQVKIVLSRKGMTIKELAEQMEQHTGKKMSRQNMTQRLGRDNFQEQDMRLIAEILGCSFQLNILEGIEDLEGVQKELRFEEFVKREVQVGTVKKLEEKEERKRRQAEKRQEEAKAEKRVQEKKIENRILDYRKMEKNRARSTQTLPEVLGQINPYTGKEYLANSVRMHPKKIGFVQVYDREKHEWADMTEWAFLGEQERKKMLLGKDYEPPVYLD